MPSVQPIEHVKFLCAEIGPRGPTTEAEARAAAYASGKLRGVGAHDVSVETFRSVPSLWWALEIATALALFSTGAYYFSRGGLWGLSVLLCAAALLIIIGEFSFWKYSLSNLLRNRISQNVHGRIPPKGEVRGKVVVIGHLDTNRTPKFFHPRIVKYLPAIVGLPIACVAVKLLAFPIGSLTQSFRGALILALLLDLPLLALLAVMLHGDFFSPFTEGANDNATGAAVALSLAEMFSRDPLQHIELWTLCTGCEEATLTGIKAFLDMHGEQLQNASFIDLECLGIGKLRYITREGMLKKYHSNPGLLRAAALAAERVGDGAVSATVLKRGYTETAIVIGRGFKGITIMAMPEGSDEVPHWHQVSDRIENVNPQNLNTAVRFLNAFIRELDAA